MNCTQCGAQLAPGAAFCGQCRQQVAPIPQQQIGAIVLIAIYSNQ